jgi:putative intracellular protease/amidase
MSALVFLAPGFEEIEAITVIDILRRAEIETVIAGLVMNPISAARQTRHLAEVHIADVDPAREFEIVILPGGAEGAKRLGESPLVGAWLNRQRERNAWVAAICAAPTALQAHGWLGSALEFAYEILRHLRGADAVTKVNAGVCAAI